MPYRIVPPEKSPPIVSGSSLTHSAGQGTMSRWITWGGLALAVALAICYAPRTYVWLASEAILDRRYTLPRSLIRADETHEGVARGARLVRLAGCTGCHGADLRGKRLRQPISIWASNLRALLRTHTDEDFDRAARRGLRPDASSLWVMPSQAYLYMRDADIAAILGYVRSLPPVGHATPPPGFNTAVRKRIIRGDLEPVAELVQVQMPALDFGPRFQGGRYIAMFACGTCHGTELTGSGDRRVPDLSVTLHYTRAQFFALLRRGLGARTRKLKTMTPLAKQRFHILQDWEIDPLYAYLVARAKAPTMDQISEAIR